MFYKNLTLLQVKNFEDEGEKNTYRKQRKKIVAFLLAKFNKIQKMPETETINDPKVFFLKVFFFRFLLNWQQTSFS